jgi:hypothetical protein
MQPNTSGFYFLFRYRIKVRLIGIPFKNTDKKKYENY